MKIVFHPRRGRAADYGAPTNLAEKRLPLADITPSGVISPTGDMGETAAQKGKRAILWCRSHLDKTTQPHNRVL